MRKQWIRPTRLTFVAPSKTHPSLRRENHQSELCGRGSPQLLAPRRLPSSAAPAAASLLGGCLPKAETRPHRHTRRARPRTGRARRRRGSAARRVHLRGRALGRTLLPAKACNRRTAAHAHGRRRHRSMAGQRWLSVLGVLCLVSTVCPRCPPSRLVFDQAPPCAVGRRGWARGPEAADQQSSRPDGGTAEKPGR